MRYLSNIVAFSRDHSVIVHISTSVVKSLIVVNLAAGGGGGVLT